MLLISGTGIPAAQGKIFACCLDDVNPAFPSDMDEPKYQIGAGQLGTPTTVN